MDAWRLLDQKEEPVLSSAETFQFFRAFYRVELYFNLFRGGSFSAGGDLEDEQTRLFFGRYSPWALEQMACVHDLLIVISEGK